MKIDSHQHFWSPARGDYSWMSGAGLEHLRKPFLPKDLEAQRRACGVDYTILVQAAPSVHETEYMLGLADATDFIAKVVGWIDFENRDDLRHLQRLAKHPKFAGVRPMIQDLPDVQWMHRKEIAWAYDAIIDLDITFDALGYSIHLDEFQRLFDRYQKMRIVVDHCMKPRIGGQAFADWAKGIAAIARTTSVFCKLSGLATEAKQGWTAATLAPYAKHVIDCFGPNRVMWGSDWPVVELNGTYARWYDAAATIVGTTDATAIFGDTAAKFYRIASV